MARRPNSPTPTQIVAKVTAFEHIYSDVHARMDADYDLWDGVEYEPEDDEDQGYKKYTSNNPRTNADKAIALLSDSEIISRVPEGEAEREDRGRHNDKERVWIGLHKAANERLERLREMRLQASMAWFATIRGGVAGRYGLVKQKEDRHTTVDITPWDPRDVSWALGADGLSWACCKVGKTRRQIKEQYGKDIDLGLHGLSAASDEDEDQVLISVFDYYDGQINKVVTEYEVLKPATLHGANFPPVYLVPNPSAPQISVGTNGQNGFKDTNTNLAAVGDSIFASNRGIYAKTNLIKSILLELVSRGRKPVLLVTSADGSKTLVEDPFKTGTTISLSPTDKVQVLDMLTSTNDTMALLGILGGEEQRGIFPNTAFGELQFQLSGFAINTLGMSLSTIIKPFLWTMETAFRQISNGLLDQYVSGGFSAVEVNGFDNNREWFSQTIQPESLKGLPAIEIKLVAALPSDNQTKYAIAKMASDGDEPILDHRTIRERVLELQDPDNVDARVKAQLARKSSSVSTAFSFMRTSAAEGDDIMAQIWQRQAELEVLKQEIDLHKLQMIASGFIQEGGAAPGQPGAAPGPAGGGNVPPGPRFDPRVAPNAQLGVPPPIPTPQVGPLMPPGSPRPGARESGLVGPRGEPL